MRFFLVRYADPALAGHEAVGLVSYVAAENEARVRELVQPLLERARNKFGPIDVDAVEPLEDNPPFIASIRLLTSPPRSIALHFLHEPSASEVLEALEADLRRDPQGLFDLSRHGYELRQVISREKEGVY